VTWMRFWKCLLDLLWPKESFFRWELAAAPAAPWPCLLSVHLSLRPSDAGGSFDVVSRQRFLLGPRRRRLTFSRAPLGLRLRVLRRGVGCPSSRGGQSVGSSRQKNFRCHRSHGFPPQRTCTGWFARPLLRSRPVAIWPIRLPTPLRSPKTVRRYPRARSEFDHSPAGKRRRGGTRRLYGRPPLRSGVRATRPPLRRSPRIRTHSRFEWVAMPPPQFGHESPAATRSSRPGRSW